MNRKKQVFFNFPLGNKKPKRTDRMKFREDKCIYRLERSLKNPLTAKTPLSLTPNNIKISHPENSNTTNLRTPRNSKISHLRTPRNSNTPHLRTQRNSKISHLSISNISHLTKSNITQHP